MNGHSLARSGQVARSARVVVVHGPADPALDGVLRGGGLVPVHEAEGAVIWASPLLGSSPVRDPENLSAALEGSGKLLLTIVEAAERLSVGRSTVYELVNRRELEVVHVGRSVRVPAAAVAGLVEELRAAGR
jgi:excisionase family DNA binding protein